MRAPLARLVAGLTLAGLLPAASLRRVERYRLADLLPRSDELPRDRSPLVRAMEFSPDGQSLALVVARDNGWFGRVNQLLVVARHRGPGQVRYSGLISDFPSDGAGFPRLAWSPGGNAVAVGATASVLVRLADGSRCDLPRTESRPTLLGGFVAEDSIVTAESGETSRLVLSGLDCRPRLHLEVAGRIEAIDADSASGRIAIALRGGTVAAYDGRTGKEIRRWAGRQGGDLKLLAGGSAICQAALPGPTVRHPQCRNVEGGGVREPELWGGSPMASAHAAPLAVFTDGKYSLGGFWDEERVGVRRFVLWDDRAGSARLSWPAHLQHCGGMLMGWEDCRVPLVLALSAEGAYLAEAGNGRLDLFQVPGTSVPASTPGHRTSKIGGYTRRAPGI